MVFRDRSFYALEVFVGPGGSREAWMFISSKIDEVKTALQYGLDSFDGVYMTVWYGRCINLMVYQQGKKEQEINLLPYITFQIPEFPLISFDVSGHIRGIDFPDRQKYGDKTADFKIETDDFVDLVLSDDFEFGFYVDWQSVPFQPLRGQLAAPGEDVMVEANYIRSIRTLPYGYSYDEDGIPRAPGFEWETEYID